MLQFIRERAQGVIAWVIVILIIIPFALWGINQYFRGGAEQPVAKVNGIGIPQRDFQRAYQQVRAFRQSLMGQNFNPALMDENEMKKDALRSLERNEILAQAAIKAGFRILIYCANIICIVTVSLHHSASDGIIIYKYDAKWLR